MALKEHSLPALESRPSMSLPSPAADAVPLRPSAEKVSLPERVKTLLPGALLAILVGGLAIGIAHWTPAWSALIWAILIGAVLTNAVSLPAALQPGITFASKQMLRFAVGLLGLRLSLSQVLDVGPVGLGLVVFAVAATFGFSLLVGKWLGLSKSLSTVLAAGTSICGASAIVAVAGVIDAKEEETAIGVGAITVYGTLVMFLFPVIGSLLGLSAEAFGLWAGASIHEVAQVIAAAFAFDAASPTGASIDIATVVKLGRVLMLAPVAIILSITYRRARAPGAPRVSPVPWFVMLFIITMVIRSSELLPSIAVTRLLEFDALLLAVSMAGLGLDLRWAKVKAAGLKPLYATLLSTVFIAAISLGWVLLFT